ncbi:hypothetical protein, partial [Adhaeribacter terreus]
VNYPNLVKDLKKKIDAFQKSPKGIEKLKRHKTIKKEIVNVECFDHLIGDRPTLLIKISAHNTNIKDGYIDQGTKVSISENDKLGSENNWIWLCPNIVELDNTKYRHHWIILVYEDPHKEPAELLSTVRLVLDKILCIPIQNIKLPEVLKELKEMGDISEFHIKLTSLSINENEVDDNLDEYFIKGEVRKESKLLFRDVPFEKIEELVKSSAILEKCSRAVIKLIKGKREYKITKSQLEEARGKLKETFEEIFNEKCYIKEEESSKEILYKPEFITTKLTPILHQYLKVANDN